MPAKRYYVKAPDSGRKVSVPSVTSVLQYGGEKGALMWWHFQQGKEAARAEIEDDAAPCNTVWDMPKRAAEVGTIVHAMIEADVHGIALDYAMWRNDLVDSARGHFRAWERWKADNTFTTEATELSLVSDRHRYGGTQDITMVSSQRTIVDYKSGKGPYASHLYQLAAYYHLWLEAHPDQEVEAVAILRVSADGSFHHHSWPTDSETVERAWAAFLACRELYDIEKAMKKSL